MVENISSVKFDYYNSLEASICGVVRQQSFGYKETLSKNCFDNKFLFKIRGDMCIQCINNITVGSKIYILGSVRNLKTADTKSIGYNIYIDVDKIFLLDNN